MPISSGEAETSLSPRQSPPKLELYTCILLFSSPPDGEVVSWVFVYSDQDELCQLGGRAITGEMKCFSYPCQCGSSWLGAFLGYSDFLTGFW